MARSCSISFRYKEEDGKEEKMAGSFLDGFDDINPTCGCCGVDPEQDPEAAPTETEEERKRREAIMRKMQWEKRWDHWEEEPVEGVTAPKKSLWQKLAQVVPHSIQRDWELVENKSF